MTNRKTGSYGVFIVVFACFIIGGASKARGELLVFRSGGRVELAATIRGRSVVVETPNGPVEFMREDFISISPSEPPARLWPARRESALRGSAEDRSEAIWWAVEHGLTFEAEKLIRSCVSLDRGRLDPAIVRMRAALDRLAGDRPDPDLAALPKCLPKGFEIARGRLFVLLHRRSAAEANARVALLERVASTFYLWTAAQGFELPAPKYKLVSVWFDDRQEYEHFLASEGAAGFFNTSGYFQPTRRLVAVRDADDRDSPILASSSTKPSDLARRRLLTDQARLAIDLGASAHETIHLLVAETGLCPRCDSFPIWLQEGLAMQFEGVRFGEWAGVDQISPIRSAHLRKLETLPRLAPLVRDVDYDRGYSADRYAEAWSLVSYLLKRHPRAFFAYLDQLRVPVFEPPADRSARFLELFRTCFGLDLSSLERDWRRSLAELRSPRETRGIVRFEF